MEAKNFTTGPWKLHSRNGFQIVGAEVPSIGIMDAFCPGICNLDGNGTYISMPQTERLANAKLIAAAPELYEALQLLLSAYVDDGSTDWGNIDPMQKAIDLLLNIMETLLT